MEKLLTVKNLVFVLTGGEEDKLVLHSAELLQQHCSQGKSRVTKFSDLGLSWQHQRDDRAYVLGVFSGEAFETLAGNCRLIGPLVVIGYIVKGWVPKCLSTEQPVFSLAMSELVICHTAIGKEQREHLSGLVTLMGGSCHADLTRITTHLVAGQVGTTKYHVAYKLGKPILLPSWVEDCWRRTLSSSEVFHATEEMAEHKCRALEGLHICVTNIDEATRNRISRQTTENGGTYCGELKKDSCTHLIVGLGKTAGSTKYKFAKQWGINCVTLQWFQDSVECGYCLEECNYIIAEGVEKDTPDNQLDWSDRLNQFVVPSHVSSCLLDGCKVCLSGFTSPQGEKLKIMINRGGGTRYNHLCDDVTHMVVGVVKGNSDIVLLQHSHLRPHVVRSDWLIECCKQDQRINEENYILIDWSKRKGERLIEPHPFKQNENNQPHPPKHHKQSGIFTGQTFVLSSEVSHDLRPLIHQLVESGGGTLNAVGGAGFAGDSHMIYPLLSSCVDQSTDYDNLITVCWLDCCMEENRLLDKQSFELFHPLVARDGLLSNCVFTVSQYSGLEKLYISRTLEQLGAVVQEQFCCQKIDNYLATTHLLLRLPEGSKYDMAKQKGVACVNCQWLVKSCTIGKLLPTNTGLFTSNHDSSANDKPDFDIKPALNILNKTDSQPANDSHVGTQKLLDMFTENLKQATSFTLHRAFPSNDNHTGSPEPANEQAPPPAGKEAELETLHTTRDDILRLQQISKDVVSTKNNRKRGKETVSNSKRIRSTRQFKGDVSGVDNSQKTPPPGVIYYDDPMGREEKEKILNRLRSDPNDDVIMDDNDRSVPIVTRSAARTEHQLYEDKQEQKQKELPKVLLSSMSPQERILYSAIVEELGGEVCSSQGFSPNCTHVIVGRPSRSEKYLAAIAAGKWVLHTSYLETSQKEHAFVEEAPYQWGLGSTDVDATPLAMAAVSWRERLICGRKGAFEGWKVFLIMDKVKESGFKRLLEAGAASVVMEAELNLCTHAFVDASHLKSSGNVKVLTKLRSDGVTCLRPEYIAEYLMHQDPPPLINQFIVQDT